MAPRVVWVALGRFERLGETYERGALPPRAGRWDERAALRRRGLLGFAREMDLAPARAALAEARGVPPAGVPMVDVLVAAAEACAARGGMPAAPETRTGATQAAQDAPAEAPKGKAARRRRARVQEAL